MLLQLLSCILVRDKQCLKLEAAPWEPLKVIYCNTAWFRSPCQDGALLLVQKLSQVEEFLTPTQTCHHVPCTAFKFSTSCFNGILFLGRCRDKGKVVRGGRIGIVLQLWDCWKFSGWFCLFKVEYFEGHYSIKRVSELVEKHVKMNNPQNLQLFHGLTETYLCLVPDVENLFNNEAWVQWHDFYF